MEKYDYLIIGGGMTAAAAVEGIREVDPLGRIGMISMEKHPPYNRPPLTKKLWQGKPSKSIWSSMPEENVDTILGGQIVEIDPIQKQARDENGFVYAYQKLLLATGGRPRQLPIAPKETVYYRTLDDYNTVRSWTGQGARIGIIGGGFIGSEIASALVSNHEKAVMVFPEKGIGARIYPEDLSNHVTHYYEEKGVEIHAGFEIESIERRGEGFVLLGKDGTVVPVDHIIAGIGIRPNVELAQAAGITVAAPEAGGGILVDKHLETNIPGIYAAGDAVSFFNPALGKITRVEHADNASSMGYVAGLNLAGRKTPYDHLPFFYSDLFDLGYEAVGDLDSRLQTAAEWQEPFRKGVIYYLKDGLIRGVLLWNTWDQVDSARKLIVEGREYNRDTEKALLPV